ncbi:MAG: RHS repeat-associated core domain-containing protein [Chloroflexi bacterium]|nr:RHS repeat-associated core domain-containing protein [Chloroflexota bacterium]
MQADTGYTTIPMTRTCYVFGTARVAMRVQGELEPAQNGLFYLHGDHLGSASLTTNNNGQPIAELRYYAYGETRWLSGTTPTDRRFTGQIELAELGLYDYGARMYVPALGRFLSADSRMGKWGRQSSKHWMVHA